jgi:hypothetical protein
MKEITLANRAGDWHRLKALVLDSVSSPITRRVYNLGLDEFIVWFGQEPRPGFTKATVNAWRADLEARGLGSVSITSGSPQFENWRLRRPTTGCWRRSWRSASRASRAPSPRV